MSVTYVPIPSSLLVRLITRYQDHYHGPLEYAVEDFLERTEEDWVAESDGKLRSFFSGRGKDGLIWGQLALPNGTELRTKYRHEWRVATVADGKVQYKDKTYPSPGKACNAMRNNTSNNAWIMLEIKRPQDIAFRAADSFR